MTIKKLLGISLALVMLIGSVPLGFSELLRVQLEQGIDTDQIQCNNDSHVLVLRTHGNIACVTEKTAEKLGWTIIQTDFKLNSINEDRNNLTFTDVFIKSDIKDADIELGLLSKSKEGKILRTPQQYPFSDGAIVVDANNLEPTINIQSKNALAIIHPEENDIDIFIETRILLLQEYLKYFPDSVPDGMELKFYTFFEGGNDRIAILYAPISQFVDPNIHTVDDLMDMGGIMITIDHDRYDIDIEKSRDGFHQLASRLGQIVETEGLYDALVMYDTTGKFTGRVQLHGQIGMGFYSASHDSNDLLKMAQKAINEELT